MHLVVFIELNFKFCLGFVTPLNTSFLIFVFCHVFRSLAPRTRKFLRTAGIAILSAVALVTIFHLARLAEHPVKEADNGKTLKFLYIH